MMKEIEGKTTGAKSFWMQSGIGSSAPVMGLPLGRSTECSSITHGEKTGTWAQVWWLVDVLLSHLFSQ